MIFFIKFDTHLNDIIIDMYLLHLINTLPEELMKDIVIFPASFYKRLCDIERTKSEGVNIAGLTHSAQMHLGVKRWTRNMDVFEKKMLIFPICHLMHWFMIVIISPEFLTGACHQQETAVIILDSLGSF